MADLNLLKPKVKNLAEKLIAECDKAGYKIKIVQTLRTIAEQDALYAQGRTKPGNIVTNAKGGYSFHNFGVAFDFCPVVNGKLDWNNKTLFKKTGEFGVKLGLDWGGNWKSFVDLPHFQYLAGYTLADFRNNKIDQKKFELDSVSTPPPAQTLKVVVEGGLNVRSGAGVENAKIGRLNFGAKIIPLETKNGWVKINFANNVGWVSKKYLA